MIHQMIIGFEFGLVLGVLAALLIVFCCSREEARSQARRDAYREAMKSSWERERRIGPQEWACWFALEAPEGSDR